MHFMLLLYVSSRPAAGTPDGADEFNKIRDFHAECSRRGVLVASAPLEEPQTATTIRTRRGRTVHTDGPFADTKEWLGGYFILECSRAEALELAELCPTSSTGSVEVRRLLEPAR